MGLEQARYSGHYTAARRERNSHGSDLCQEGCSRRYERKSEAAAHLWPLAIQVASKVPEYPESRRPRHRSVHGHTYFGTVLRLPTTPVGGQQGEDLRDTSWLGGRTISGNRLIRLTHGASALALEAPPSSNAKPHIARRCNIQGAMYVRVSSYQNAMAGCRLSRDVLAVAVRPSDLDQPCFLERPHIEAGSHLTLPSGLLPPYCGMMCTAGDGGIVGMDMNIESDRAGRVIRHYCRSRVAPRMVEPHHPVIRLPSPPSGDGVAGTYAGRAHSPATEPALHLHLTSQRAHPERYGLPNAQLTCVV